MSVARAGLALALAAALALASPASADAPPAGSDAPGFYRMRLGAFEITALFDGTLEMPAAKLLTNVTPAAVRQALAAAYLDAPVATSVNGFLVNTGTKLVLVDAGAGASGLFGPKLNRLVANLEASGYRPEQVDDVLITHMHADHVGGLASARGERVFPNATVHADRREAAYWLSAARLAAAPPDDKPDIEAAMAALAPYRQARRFEPFDGGTQIVPGIRARPAYGHTPGHCTYEIESQGRKLVLWGDLVHVAAVQFAHPEAGLRFDSDPTAATRERRRALAQAARRGWWVGAAHVSFPGLGHVRREGAGFAWVPANYEPLR